MPKYQDDWITSSGSFKLKVLHHQSLHASIEIQRISRGYLTRRTLWSYGGVFYVYCVLRVQCAWRQYLALKAVRYLWCQKVERSVHRIHSLFYLWKSRRIRRIVRLMYLKNIITKFQANVRRKLMRKKYLVLLFLHRTKNAKKIQSIIRCFLSKCQVHFRKQSIYEIVHFFVQGNVSKQLDQIKTDISFIIAQKILEISPTTIPKLYHNLFQFSFSIIYDLSVNNQCMNAFTKVHYLNLCFQKVQYNLLQYLKANKNHFNKLLYQSSSPLLVQLQRYHHFQFLVQFLNYLTRMNLWTKYNKTRQIHLLLLEQALGIIACQYTLLRYNYELEEEEREDCKDEEESLKVNPLALNSLLLLPKQIFTTRQSVIATSSSSAHLLSRSQSSSERSLKKEGGGGDTAGSSNSPAASSPRVPLADLKAASSIRASFTSPTTATTHTNTSSACSGLQQSRSSSTTAAPFTFLGNPNQAAMQPLLLLAAQATSSPSFWHWQKQTQIEGSEDSAVLSLSAMFRWTYLISSKTSLSLLRQFDALMYKVDASFFALSFPDLTDSIALSTRLLLQRRYSPFLLVFPEDERETAITNLHLYQSPTPDKADSSRVIHSGLPFYRITARPLTRSANPAEAEEPEISAQDLQQVQDIQEFRRLQRKRKEKKVIQRIRQPAKSARHRAMHRIWKLLDQAREMVVPGSLDSYELSYRMDFFNAVFQSVHEGFVLREEKKDFVMVLNSEGQSLLPEQLASLDNQSHPSHSSKAKDKAKRLLAAAGNPHRLMSITVTITVKIIISGNIIFLTGSIPAPSSKKTTPGAQEEEEAEENSPGRGKGKKTNRTNDRLLNTFILEKIPLFPWPLHPLVLFPHEINQLANNHKIFSVQQFSIGGNNSNNNSNNNSDNPTAVTELAGSSAAAGTASAPRLSRRLSSNQWIDYEKFADFLLSESSIIFTSSSSSSSSSTNDHLSPLVSSFQPFVSTDSEPLLSFYLPEIHQRRQRMLDSNIMKYSALVIQRIFRGFLGRRKFRWIRENYLVMKRKRYLSYKVFYRLKVMYFRHTQAAIAIQRIIRGVLLRNQIRRWHFFMLKIQCRVRMFFAKKKVQEERRRLFDGPQVQLVNRGGKMIEIQSQWLLVFIYRCQHHYRFVGTDAVLNTSYSGYLYEKDLKRTLRQYNQDVIVSLNGDQTSMYSKQLQIQHWQVEKLIGFFYRYLNLYPKPINLTTQFQNVRREEPRYYLAVGYPPPPSAAPPSFEAPFTLESNQVTEVSRSGLDDVPVTWRHNYGNIYRSRSQTSTTVPAVSSSAAPDFSKTASAAPLTWADNKRLQKEIPKEFDQHPVLESVKKFQIFRDYNHQQQRGRPREKSPKSPGKSLQKSKK